LRGAHLLTSRDQGSPQGPPYMQQAVRPAVRLCSAARPGEQAICPVPRRGARRADAGGQAGRVLHARHDARHALADGRLQAAQVAAAHGPVQVQPHLRARGRAPRAPASFPDRSSAPARSGRHGTGAARGARGPDAGRCETLNFETLTGPLSGSPQQRCAARRRASARKPGSAMHRHRPGVSNPGNARSRRPPAQMAHLAFARACRRLRGGRRGAPQGAAALQAVPRRRWAQRCRSAPPQPRPPRQPRPLRLGAPIALSAAAIGSERP